MEPMRIICLRTREVIRKPISHKTNNLKIINNDDKFTLHGLKSVSQVLPAKVLLGLILETLDLAIAMPPRLPTDTIQQT